VDRRKCKGSMKISTKYRWKQGLFVNVKLRHVYLFNNRNIVQQSLFPEENSVIVPLTKKKFIQESH